ncbi:RagB/SusD family nutrient uptake outer membrane protein [Flavobacterium sp.]|uniref:RagB/SusD family nutrient uptake outer membrane protein n=1 Tax=Flavobacterium sp. TaxID=239 RepID=UPI0040488EAA
MKKNFIKVLVLATLGLSTFSCSDDLLEPTVAQSLTVESSVNTYDDLRVLMNGAYDFMADYRYWGRNIVLSGEVRADNVYANASSGRFLAVGAMDIDVSNADIRDIYQFAYKVIANCNIVINSSVSGDADMIRHIKGEALTLRALAHFDLLRVFGQHNITGQGGLDALGICYVTEFKSSNLYPTRNTVAQVRDLIYSDLDDAVANFDSSLNDPEKYSVTSDAAYAIKSRVAIYFGDRTIAKNACEAIINNYSIASRSNYASTFSSSAAASNSIFELVQLSNDNNSINGLASIYRKGQNNVGYGDIQVLNQFISDAGFDSDDVRSSTAMIDFDFGSATRMVNVGKYPTMASGNYSDNIKVVRYEEVVLNYAEALLDSNPTEALNQLNRIVTNRETSPNLYTVANLANILKERRKELCFEGFRFDDLARTGQNIPVLDAVAQTHGGPVFGSYNYAFPIPLVEINSNTNMAQNFGY